MTGLPLPLASLAGSFLLAFPALFSIVNPLAGALVFNRMLADRTDAERRELARRVAVYSLAVLLGSLWFGAYLLNFFGITLGAVRVAGGAVVAARAWALLEGPEASEPHKEANRVPQPDLGDPAFFPLTLPFTTGPGTISVAIALSAQRPMSGVGLVPFFLGDTAAAAAIAVVVWIAYRSADRLIRLLGQSGARIVTRLTALLLLAIGVQILLNGVADVLVPMLRR